MAAATIAVVAKRRQHAVVGQVPDRADDPTLAIAKQAERVAVAQSERSVEGAFAETPARADRGFVGGFEQKERLDLAGRMIPDRQHGALARRTRLRVRARDRRQGEGQAQQQSAGQESHGGIETGRLKGSSSGSYGGDPLGFMFP